MSALLKLRKAMCELSLVDFLRLHWDLVDPSPYQHGRHLDLIADALMRVSAGEIKRLLINIPPRFCKSTLTAVAWPAWDWIRNPNRQWFTLSHSEKLAIRDSRRMRQLVESVRYQRCWPLEMADDQNEKKAFVNEHLGKRQCAGLDSGFTGEGGDVILIDDPIDRDQAESANELERVCLQYDEKVQSRLNDAKNSAVVIVGQRIAANDLFGHLMGKGDRWHVLCLPHEFEGDHPVKTTVPLGDWRTEEGELLWPERIDRDTAEAMKVDLTSFAWAGQQQQRPSPRGGGIFKREWFKIIDKLPGVPEKAVRYWDMAATDGGGDWSAGVLVCRIGADYIVCDVRRGQWNPTERKRQMRLAAESDAERFHIRVELWEEREGGSTGVEAAELHVIEFSEYGLRTERATGSKVTRAELSLAQAEHGHVFLLAGPWNGKFLDEIESFPTGKNDDQVDGYSGAMAKLLLKKKWALAGMQKAACPAGSPV